VSPLALPQQVAELQGHPDRDERHEQPQLWWCRATADQPDQKREHREDGGARAQVQRDRGLPGDGREAVLTGEVVRRGASEHGYDP
jgi:hypothetical protein